MKEEEYYILKELERRRTTIQMIAAENITRQSILNPLSSVLACKTCEGFVGSRYHSGSEVVDEIENDAEKIGEKLFGSRKVFLQPHSGSNANIIVISTLLSKYLGCGKKATILSMGLDQGGHLSHGSEHNLVGKIFNVKSYSVDRRSYLLDYEVIDSLAKKYHPKLIICGASSYPREIDFKAFGDIARDNNAYLLSDIAHILGFVITGLHNSPVPHSNFVTSSTYKAGGPRGGLIVAGARATEDEIKNVKYGVFPGVQSTPNFATILSKGLFFEECMTNEYKKTQEQIIKNARTLAFELMSYGFDVLTGGTDNHKVILNIKNSHSMTGKAAEDMLVMCGINANKNLIPYDEEKPTVTSGLRFGLNVVTRIGMKEKEVKEIASMIDEILTNPMTDEFCEGMKKRIKELMSDFDVTL